MSSTSSSGSGAGLLANPIIKQPAYWGSLGALFGVAIIAFISRTYIRIWKFRKLSCDDYFLIVGVLALIASFVLQCFTIPNEYLFSAVLGGEEPMPLNFFDLATNTTTYGQSAQITSWLCIFSVKYSFLFYFRALIRRIRKLMIWWWITAVALFPIAVVTIFSSFIVCPHTGVDYLLCASGPTFLPREAGILYYSVVADSVTDGMLLVLPVALLTMARFSMRQKVSIGIFLCLSVVMILIAILRGISSTIYEGGKTDQVWISYWVNIEGCIAVIMVSMTAFRTLFVVNEKNSGRKLIQRSPPMRKGNKAVPGAYRSTATTVNPDSGSGRKWYGLKKKDMSQLPSINVNPELSGMRTVIWGNGRTRLDTTSSDEENASTVVPSHDGGSVRKYQSKRASHERHAVPHDRGQSLLREEELAEHEVEGRLRMLGVNRHPIATTGTSTFASSNSRYTMTDSRNGRTIASDQSLV